MLSVRTKYLKYIVALAAAPMVTIVLSSYVLHIFFEHGKITLSFIVAVVTLLTAIVISIFCFRLVDSQVFQKLKDMRDMLERIRNHRYDLKLQEEIRSTEFADIYALLNALADELKSHEATWKSYRESNISAVAARLDCEMRTTTLAQHYILKLEANVIEAFQTLETIPDKDNPSFVEVASTSRYILGKVMVEARMSVNQVLALMDKKELPRLQSLTAEPMKHFADVIEHSVSTLSERKNLDIRLFISDEIIHSKAFLFFDPNATARLLALSLEYWPNRLELKQIPWHINVFIKQKEDTHKLRIELLTDGEHLNEDQLIDIQSFLSKPTVESHDPYQKLISKLQGQFHIAATFGIEERQQIVFGYECDFISGKDKESTINEYRARYGREHPFLIIGSKDFLEQISQVLTTLYIDTVCIEVHDEFSQELASKTIPIAIIDFTYDFDAARDKLAIMLRSLTTTPLTVAYAKRQFKEQNEEELKANLDVDKVLSPPADLISIVEAAKALSSNIFVSDAIESMRKQSRSD